jgi:tRNA pseudouridine55 synthase
MPSGVLVLDKPCGPTSHDVVARVRRALGTRAVGHAGTLDPAASGVLVVAVEEATKLVPYLTLADKSYVATMSFGVETDTLDAAGREVGRAPVSAETRAAIESIRRGEVPTLLVGALAREQERTRQVPPAFSAIKQGGQPAYKRARRGEEVVLEEREVSVRSIRLLDGGLEPEPWLAVELDVSKGYYVRSVARDLAAALGTVGHLTALRRTRSGPFTLDDAMPLDTPGAELDARLLPLTRAATRCLPVVRLPASAAALARVGKPVAREDLGDCVPGPHAWLGPDGELLAIGALVLEEGVGRVLRGFHGDPPPAD